MTNRNSNLKAMVGRSKRKATRARKAMAKLSKEMGKGTGKEMGKEMGKELGKEMDKEMDKETGKHMGKRARRHRIKAMANSRLTVANSRTPKERHTHPPLKVEQVL